MKLSYKTRMKRALFLIILLVGFQAQSIQACSPPPAPPPMTKEEQADYDRKLIENFAEHARNSKAIIEVKALTSSRRNFSSALFEVKKVLRGIAKKGSIIRLKTVGASLCGAGGVKRKERGVVLLPYGKDKTFGGFLREDQLEILRSKRLIPERSQ